MRHILKRTGIFFHQQTGNRLRDFPEAIYAVLAKDNVLFYDVLGDPLLASGSDMYIDYDLMHRVHSSCMIEQIASQDAFEGILISGFSTVWSSVKIFSGEIDNAFVFTGFGDHHAGRETFGGGGYLNGAAMAVSELRERFGVGRVAIIDTDAHPGDGAWDIFKDETGYLSVSGIKSVGGIHKGFNTRHILYSRNKQNLVPCIVAKCHLPNLSTDKLKNIKQQTLAILESWYSKYHAIFN